MAQKSRQQRKLELLSELKTIRSQAPKGPKELIVSSVDLKKKVQQKVLSAQKTLVGSRNLGIRSHNPRTRALAIGVVTFLGTLLLKRKKKRSSSAVINYLPVKKVGWGATLFKYTWTLALPFLKKWVQRRISHKAKRLY